MREAQYQNHSEDFFFKYTGKTTKISLCSLKSTHPLPFNHCHNKKVSLIIVKFLIIIVIMNMY